MRATKWESAQLEVSEFIRLNTITMRWEIDSVSNGIMYGTIALDAAINAPFLPSAANADDAQRKIIALNACMAF